MLDGLLGRGFSSKCKSRIKLINARIDKIRRKRNAMQKYLKKDIADLLADGFESNAYGRVERLLVDLYLSSCYDFVEQFCECISKQLPIMQKQRECPEECKEAVQSLIFAAARFSDLPELRDLRHIFQERYGAFLESFVNQEFVEKISPKPPTRDKKLQLMQGISQEYSITWDSKAFEEHMCNSHAFTEGQNKKNGSFYDTNYNGFKSHFKEDEKQDFASQGRWEVIDEVNKRCNGWEDAPSKRDNRDLSSSGRQEHVNDGYKPPNRRADSPKRDNQDNLPHERPESTPSYTRSQQAKTDGKDAFVVGNNPNASEGNSVSMKPFHCNVIPPPYTKPKVHKNGINSEARYTSSDCNEAPMDPPTRDRDVSDNRLETGQPGLDHFHCERPMVGCDSVNSRANEKDCLHQDEFFGDATPKPRSVRRRNLKPPPGRVNVKDVEVEKRNSGFSRTEDERQGVQTLSDDYHHQEDEEEKIMDRLLVHYSKKHSTNEPGKERTRLEDPPSHVIATNADESLQYRSRDAAHTKSQLGHPPARAMSLPPEPTTPTEVLRGPTRAASFQPEWSNPVGHVHPKLPDYDDLAAHFAALRGR